MVIYTIVPDDLLLYFTRSSISVLENHFNQIYTIHIIEKTRQCVSTSESLIAPSELLRSSTCSLVHFCEDLYHNLNPLKPKEINATKLH